MSTESGEITRNPIKKGPLDVKYGHSEGTFKPFGFKNRHDKWVGKSLSPKERMQRRFNKFTPEVKKLMARKDLLHFMLSYPVKPLLDETYQIRLDRCLPTLKLVVGALLEDDKRTISEADYSLRRSFYGAGNYLPTRWELMLTDQGVEELSLSNHDKYYLSMVKKFPSWAIKSAIRQASQCILEEEMKLISISGQEAGKVAKALKDKPEMESKFDIVLYIAVSQHHSIEDIDECIGEQIDQLHEANSSTLSLDEVKTYRFLLMLDCVDEQILDNQILKTIMDRDYACVVLATRSQDIYQTVVVDMDIRMEYHLLPLELFVHHARLYYSDRKQLAFNLLEQCHEDLFAIVLLAKELREAYDIIWKEALDELTSHHSSLVEKDVSEPMIPVLKFIWKRKDAITKSCIQGFATHSSGEKLTATSLVSSWLTDDLVQTEKEGKAIVNGLTKSSLIESNYQTVIMREDIKDVVASLGLRLTARAIVDDAEIINLKNSQVTKLPDSPNCPPLVLLCLHNNCNLMRIPPLFFKHMPVLSTLNLSNTSIKTLPASVSALVSLKKLFIRDCDLFLELPPEIGQLSDLEVIDLEGTKVMYLPEEIARLKKLREFKLSFYNLGKGRRRSKQRIPKGVLSDMRYLKELRIGLNPVDDDDEWIADIQNILLHLPKDISNIMLYVPETRLLEQIPDLQYKKFKLAVGRRGKRTILRIPYDVEQKLNQHERYLQYVNGECIPTEIKRTLNCAEAFLLDRHWTVKKLSEFGAENLEQLRSCLLVDCKELQTIFDEGDDDLFEYLMYLGIYYMKNLRSICSAQINMQSLRYLRHLSLGTCTSLNSVFTISLLSNLEYLEELVLEDCPKIESLVTPDGCASVHGRRILPRLKKMSLLELPELVSISNGLQIAPNLEKLVIFYCPKLESISELRGGNLKVVKGETEWWNSLSWQETDPLASIFVPLEIDGDLATQFTED